MYRRKPTVHGAGQPPPDVSPQAVYVAALVMLGRRELSESQVRQRLARKGYGEDDIEAAITRLKAERALDDVRVAEAIARTETGLKKRGKLRVRRQIEAAGISPALTRQTVEAHFDEVDADGLLLAALGRRLRDGRHIADDREFQRLYRHLTAQGFESDQVLRLLRSRRASGTASGRDEDE